jgi:ATP-dependent helicase/nuclease subunit A
VKWTPEQLRGIQTTGRSLLVSAAAGSGKTAVLAERCAYLVLDAQPPCDVDQLLVVTFTEAAAAEMKGRIEAVLRERLAKVEAEDDPRLVRQLALIERAQVSTLHGFCSRVLRQNFHLLGLDPTFSMLDGDEAKLLRIEVARELFARAYERDADGDFGRLVRFYASGDDELLIPHVVRTHEMLCSVVDPEAWLAAARRRIDEAAEGEFDRCEAGRELVRFVAEKVEALHRRCADALRTVAGFEGLEKYGDYLTGLLTTLEDWRDLLRIHGLDALAAAVKDFGAPRLPTIKGEVAGKDLAKAAIDSVREEMGDKGSLAQIARFSRAEWQAGMRSVAPLAGAFLDLVEQFAADYRRAKDQARRLDFNDLERFALRILRDEDAAGLRPSGVARTYHRQFEHVLVDEYQDINEVQDAILNLVSRECLADEPGTVQNLFCVGDVKQSIYRFRLAEPARFLARYAKFKAMAPSPEGAKGDASPSDLTPVGEGGGEGSASPSGEVIDLQANFRSRGPLLNVLNELFARVMTAAATDIEYDQSHYLRPGASFPPADGVGFAGSPIELHVLPEDVPVVATGGDDDPEELDRSEREAHFVARRIRQLMGQDGHARVTVADKGPGGEKVLRPIEYRDVVILLRSMKFKADQYAGVLRQAGIPAFREGGQGYFESMEVRDVRALLTLLDNPRQDIPMAAVLRSPLAGLADPEDCLARVRLAYPSRPEAGGGGQRAEGREAEGVPFHVAVVRYAAEQEDELAARLRDFLDALYRWRQLARHRPLAELIWEVYSETGYLAFVEGLTNGPQRVANLVELHRRAAQFGSFSRQGLYRFLKFLDSLEQETDFGQPSVLSAAADVVRIMSVHHSKGLEFPVVFLPELGKRINLQDCQGSILLDKRAGLALSAVDEEKRIRYPSLATVIVQTSLRRQSLAEELRVLYVAATRAKEHLILSGTCSDKKCEQWASRWANVPGPLPPEDVLGASCMLDWVGPAVAMIGREDAFATTVHSPEEVAQWTGAELRRPGLSPWQQRLANLEPLQPAPAADERARRIVESLTAAYPHAAASHLEAARSVTDWSKTRRAAPAGYASTTAAVAFAPTLATPRCLQDRRDLSAAEVGSATHVVLQHLDFARPCVEEDLAEQMNALVTRRLLTPAQARHVDLAAIEWLMGTELGGRLRAEAGSLRRELDFYLAVPPAAFAAEVVSGDLGDQVMVRGRVDALLVAKEGLTVIDYKTDRVTPDRLAERAAFYRGQVTHYRDALARITGRPVVAVHLVFLAARQIVSV